MSGAMQAALDRADRTGKSPGNFLIGHVVPIAHDNHSSFLLSKNCQEILNGCLFLFSVGLVFRIGGGVRRVVFGKQGFEGEDGKPFSTKAAVAVMSGQGK